MRATAFVVGLYAWVLVAASTGVGASPPAARPAGGEVAASVDEGGATISNEHIAVRTRFSGEARTGATIAGATIAGATIAGATIAGETVENRRAGTRLELEGEDVRLELAGGRKVRTGDLRIVEARVDDVEGGGKRIGIELEGDNVGGARLRIRRTTELRPGRWWVERRVEVRAVPGAAEAAAVVRLSRLVLGDWAAPDARGPSGPGGIVPTLGYPSGCGQAVHAGHCFLALAHPAGESYARDGRVSFAVPVERDLPPASAKGSWTSSALLIGAGERGASRRAFLGAIDATRPVPARMVILVNDWYWKRKDRPLEALEALVALERASGISIDSFTLDDGWDLDWDAETGIWGRLNRQRFPGGWDALQEAGRKAGIGISLWFGPIGGYGGRDRRVAKGAELGFETHGDKLCLAGPRYRAHVVESFRRWARLGMDYIKVDGFWPDCPRGELGPKSSGQEESGADNHGHPPAPSGAAAQMEALMETFAAWREARRDLVIGYTSGSSPSPFWLQHADFVWRGGLDDSHAGAGEPFDRHNTYLDICLQSHRPTDMPISAFVVFDIVQDRVVGSSEAAFARGAWWLAARTSLHHDWYLQASDLPPERWEILKRAAEWARSHEKVFRWSRMVGGDPAKGEVYGFAAWDAGSGTLGLRNPSGSPASIEGTLGDLLDLPEAERGSEIELRGVFGETRAVEGVRGAAEPFRLEIPGLSVSIWDVERAS